MPKEVSLGLGSYETAWTWLHKLRHAMVRPGRDRLSGTVEIDEIYMGGVKKGTYGREAGGKALVLIAAEKDGRRTGRIRLHGWMTHPPAALYQPSNSVRSLEVWCALTGGTATCLSHQRSMFMR